MPLLDTFYLLILNLLYIFVFIPHQKRKFCLILKWLPDSENKNSWDQMNITLGSGVIIQNR
jgi:hypothetical protein